MKTLVTYQSKTGFTQKYAEWISQELACDLREVSKVSEAEIAEYELVIHGGWIMGGMINGLDKIRSYHPKKLIVFGVGYTKKEETDLKASAEQNKLGDTPLFYYEGGMNPKKMGFIGRTMVKMVTKKTPVFEDNTRKEEIKELVEFAGKC